MLVPDVDNKPINDPALLREETLTALQSLSILWAVNPRFLSVVELDLGCNRLLWEQFPEG